MIHDEMTTSKILETQEENIRNPSTYGPFQVYGWPLAQLFNLVHIFIPSHQWSCVKHSLYVWGEGSKTFCLEISHMHSHLFPLVGESVQIRRCHKQPTTETKSSTAAALMEVTAQTGLFYACLPPWRHHCGKDPFLMPH